MKTNKTLATKLKQKSPRNGRLDKSLSINKIRESYKDQWLAVHLTKVDRYDNPLAGIVVANATTSDVLYAQAKQYRLKNPAAKLYTFRAGNYIPDGCVIVLSVIRKNLPVSIIKFPPDFDLHGLIGMNFLKGLRFTVEMDTGTLILREVKKQNRS